MDGQREPVTEGELAERMFSAWLEPEGVQFKTPEAEECYRQRIRRVRAALQLKVPDRVPFAPTFGVFPAFYGGITVEDAMYDYDRAHRAWKQTMLDMAPDLYCNSSGVYPGRAFDVLEYRLMKWPGRGLGPNQVFQYLESDYMKAEEYDHFLADPSDFMVRKYYPRIFGKLQPLGGLQPLHNGMWMEMLGLIGSFGASGIRESFEALLAAAEEMKRWFAYLKDFDREMQGLGYPCLGGGMTFAPFDLIGDTLRGTRGIMLDMYRHPQKLLEAIDKLTPVAIEMGASGPRQSGNPMVWIYLHKGAAGYMSDEQFHTFYWPSLRALVLGLLEQGLTPCVYTEGDYTPRLEALTDVPTGKVLYHFETVDMRRAKETLGNIACISGNVPLPLLVAGTVEEVREYCKGLIDVAGKEGGFILDSAAAINEARAENVKAMGDCCQEYGIYR